MAKTLKLRHEGKTIESIAEALDVHKNTVILLLRQLKIDVLSALVVTDKLELGEPQASGKSAPAGA